MKTIQALARYFPDPCGGIQVNLTQIIPELRSLGIESIIAAGKINQQPQTYSYQETEVYRYPIFPHPNRQLHNEIPHGEFPQFAHWLAQQQADIYHQHHLEVSCGLPHLRLAKELGMKTVVTIHYPIPICQRHTLMFQGKEVCDGKIDPVRCSHCSDPQSQNIPKQLVNKLSRIPVSILNHIPLPVSAYLTTAEESSSQGRLIRPFLLPSFIATRQKNLVNLAKYADQIIVVCDWLYKVLLVNDIPPEKIALCRYGIPNNTSCLTQTHSPINETLKIAFLGRWDIYKGIDILVKAIKNLPNNIPIQLIIHGIAQDENYRQQIINLIAQDSRIQIAQQLTREEINSVISNYDLIAVPSQWLETGPLVVLEAYGAGLPVIGSNIGGIPELVKHGVDGWLVPHNDVSAWTEALKNLAQDRKLLAKLKQGIQPVRTISQQAQELVGIYQNLPR